MLSLSIVLERDKDLGSINRSHPDRMQHSFFNKDAEFPPDISDLLLPSEDRWWEHLGKPQLLRFTRHPAYELSMIQKLRLLAKGMPPKPPPNPLPKLPLKPPPHRHPLIF